VVKQRMSMNDASKPPSLHHLEMALSVAGADKLRRQDSIVSQVIFGWIAYR